MNTSDVLIETIAEWGVDTVFGLPGSPRVNPRDAERWASCWHLRIPLRALQAKLVLEQAQSRLILQRGNLGAFQTRVTADASVTARQGESLAAAESRLRDTDIADDSSKTVKLNILRETTSAVLAQANQQPALAIRLLS